MKRTLLVTAVLVVALCGAAATGVSAQETVSEYDMDGDFDDLTFDEGETYRLDLADVDGNITIWDDSNTSNATVLLSTEANTTGEYETNENVSWTDESPDYVEFTATSDANFTDDLDGGWYETDGDAAGTISVSSGLLPPVGASDAAAVLGVPVMLAGFGALAVVLLIVLLVAVVRAL
jgi:hypothetical protein